MSRRSEKRVRFTKAQQDKVRYVIYTDGGCDVNPGGKGGIGVVILDKQTNEVVTHSEAYAVTTNNRMELRAAIYALSHLQEHGNVMLHSDSQYLVRTMHGEYQKKKNVDLWKALQSAQGKRRVTYIWVKGHSTNELNNLCDELATRAIQTGPYLRDEGYSSEGMKVRPAPASNAGKTNAMRTRIALPGKYERIQADANLHGKKVGINPACVKAIERFKQIKNPRFGDYVKLKTDGTDDWSSKKKADLIALFGKKRWNIIHQILEDDKATAAALRWYGRGLSMEDSIRKALVDMDMHENIQELLKSRQFTRGEEQL